MGLFTNFDKPGRGVGKGEKRPKGLVWFFELLTRKTGSYVELNVIYIITLIPGFLAVWYFLLAAMDGLLGDKAYAAGFSALAMTVAMILTVLFSLSPFSSGYYYVLRNYVKEDNAWVFSDFFGKFKENIGKSLLIFFIDLAFVCLSIFVIRAYAVLNFKAALWGIILIFAIYAFSVPYRWIMTVTFDLKLKEIYKNSIFLLFSDSKRNLLYFLAVVFYIFVFSLLASFKSVVPVILIMAVIGVSCLGLVQTINTYPVIDRLLIKQNKKDEGNG